MSKATIAISMPYIGQYLTYDNKSFKWNGSYYQLETLWTHTL